MLQYAIVSTDLNTPVCASRKKNKYEQSAPDSWHIRKCKNQEANKPDKLKEFVVERVS